MRPAGTSNKFIDPPNTDTVPIHEFMLKDSYRGLPTQQSRDPFTCGLSGLSYSAAEVVDRVDYLARALSKELGWHPNQGTEWDKVVGIFALNTVWCCLVYIVVELGG